MNDKSLNNGTGWWRTAFLKPQASSLKSAAALVGVALILALPTAASADPIRFDNAPVGDQDHFVWYGADGTYRIGLNITQDLAGQDGSFGDLVAVFGQTGGLSSDVSSWGTDYGQLQMGGDGDNFIVGIDYSADIPSGLPWRDSGLIYHPYAPAPHTWLPLDAPTYLGVQFPDTDGTHYGWIGVTMFLENPTDPTSAHWLDAFAWGYETTPDTPIAAGVPEPGTLALLAVGAVGLLRRRRA